MVNFSEVVSTLAGNGFTNAEAIQTASKISELSDMNRLWVVGVSDSLIKKSDFVSFDPQNEWQEKIVRKLIKLSPRERQCYFLRELQKMPTEQIGEKLGISRSAVVIYLHEASDKLSANRRYKITKDLLDLLSPRDQECYILREYYSLTYADIGRELGISQAAAQNYVSKAKRRFRYFHEKKSVTA